MSCKEFWIGVGMNHHQNYCSWPLPAEGTLFSGVNHCQWVFLSQAKSITWICDWKSYGKKQTLWSSACYCKGDDFNLYTTKDQLLVRYVSCVPCKLHHEALICALAVEGTISFMIQWLTTWVRIMFTVTQVTRWVS
jgi:hypothetical protein